MAIEAATALGQAEAANSAAEHARMGRVSGGLWIVGSIVAVVGLFLPGTDHASPVLIAALSMGVLAYGVGSVTGWIPWARASLNALGVGMVVTIPVVGLAIYLTGASLSYIEPLLVCSLLYAAFFFPPRWAWPLSIELLLFAGTPLVYDEGAIENAFLPRYYALVAAFLAVAWVMMALKQRLQEAETLQRRIANRDHLTGVGNRRAFDAVLRSEIEARQRPGRGRRQTDGGGPLALLVIDLDDFKGVNDRFGHQAGDEVLRATAERLGTVGRSTDMIARIGGDEFAVIAPGAGPAGASRLAQAIRETTRAAAGYPELPVATPSVGWAIFPDDASDVDTLLREADRRMLESKVDPLQGRVVGPPSLLDKEACSASSGSRTCC